MPENQNNPFQGKRIALVHDWLNGMRGGEKCLEVLCEIFPDATLFTLIHEQGRLSEKIEKMKISTSFIQKLPLGVSHYRHYLPIMPKAIESFDLSDFDLIVSTSHCVAKGVIPGPDAFHISYVHAPMRYVWDAFDTYFRRAQTRFWIRWAALMTRPYLQRWDRMSSSRVHQFLCNSVNIQKKVKQYYGRESKVIHPPVDLERFTPGEMKKDFYLMIGAFAPNKRVDLAIRVFNRLKLPLNIVGKGQDEAFCRSIAGESISFLGECDDEQLLELYQQARAFVFPGEDDFGITPLEAQACGTPVIAYAAGGALETVTETTGIFFEEQTEEALRHAVEDMEQRHLDFKPENFKKNTSQFSRERYKNEMFNTINNAYSSWNLESP